MNNKFQLLTNSIQFNTDTHTHIHNHTLSHFTVVSHLISSVQAFGDLRTLDSVLNCVGHPQSEVAEITFNFWYRLSEVIYKRDSRELTDMYRPYIERLIHSLCVHCQIDSEHVSNRAVLFRLFKKRVNLPPKPVSFRLTFSIP